MTFRLTTAALVCAASCLAADANKKSEKPEAAPAKPPSADEPQLGIANPSKTGLLPRDTTALGKKAADAFGKRDWAGARAAYREMLEVDPENALVWANLGAVEQQAGKLEVAAECLEKSVRYNPTLVQSWLALGLTYSAKGDKYRAMSAFSRALHEDPLDARAHNHLAIVAKYLGWTDAAEAELQRAIDLNPDYGIAHFNLALMYLERKPPAIELAKRHYTKATALGMEKDEIGERKLKE